MTEYGEMSYKVLPGTHIGDLAITERVMNQMKEIAAGKLNPEACLREIRQMVVDDIATMQANAKDAGLDNAPAQKEKATGIFNGETVSFNREWSGHRFTDDEVQALLRGEEIELYGVVGKSGKAFDVKGKLTQQTYNGKQFYGFENTGFISNQNAADRYSGVWNGQQVSFKREWGGHKFTDAECEALLRGEEIEITDCVSKSGSTYGVKGKLSQQTYNGRPFVGFEKTDFLSNGNNNGQPAAERYSGKFKGKDVSFKRTWGGHRFTDEECEALLRGEEITITGLVSKSGSTYGVKGKLKKMSYQGNPYYGFDKTDFV
jgi:DNA topoisomerase-3